MTNKQTEALKLALEALTAQPRRIGPNSIEPETVLLDEAITAIREALAEQPQGVKFNEGMWQEREARIVQLEAELMRMEGRELRLQFALAGQPAQQEIEELTAQRDKLADILTRTANALKGQPAELSSHSWHDLPEVAQQLKAAQPAQQQEPVFWYRPCSNGMYEGPIHNAQIERVRKESGAWHPLYTSPPASKPLTDSLIKTRTDEQIEATFKRHGGRWNGDHWVIEDADLHPFVRTIEGSELNTLRAISDEYNAWIKHHAAGHSYDDFLAKREAAHGIKK